MVEQGNEKVHIREKCLCDGHKFREIAGVPLPYVFCRRWRCDASAVSRWADPRIAVDLHNAIPLAKRFPQVELAQDGSVIWPTPVTAPPAGGEDRG